MRGLHLVAAAAVALVFGCNSILGIEEARVDDGSGGTGGSGSGGTGGFVLPDSCAISPSDDACSACEKSVCCDALTACASNPDCSAFVECTTSCGADAACISGCASQFPNASGMGQDFGNCVGTYCSAECSSPVGGCQPPVVDPDLVRSCVLGTSCDPYPTFPISRCITLAALDSVPFLSCEWGATNCGEIGACTGTQFGDRGVCTGSETGWICDGNVAVRCDDGPPYFVDCSVWGGDCVPGDSWPCNVQGAVGSCGETDGGWHCAGDYVYTCLNGVPRGYDCQVQSGACVEPTTGDGGCTLSRATCGNLDEQVCSGDTLTYCNTNGYYYEYDCTSANGLCQTSSTGDNCYAPGCAENDCQESCSGSVMTLCIGGAPMEVDCGDYGFSACTTQTDGSGNDYTYCTNQP